MNWMLRRDYTWQPRVCFGIDPVTLATAAAGTILGAVGQANQGAAAASQANYQAQVARNNQTIAERNAELATEQGEAQATQQQLRTAQQIGAQRAQLASQGSDIDSGSPLDIQADTARAGAYNVANDRYNAFLNSYNYQLQGANQAGLADDDEAEAANARAKASLGVGQTLLGGASSLFGKPGPF